MGSQSSSTTDTKKANPATKDPTATVYIRKATPPRSASQPTAAPRGRPDAPQNHTSVTTSQTLPKSQDLKNLPNQQGRRTASLPKTSRAASGQQLSSGQDQEQNRKAPPAQGGNGRNSSPKSEPRKMETFEVVPAPKVLKGEKRRAKEGSFLDMKKSWELYEAGKLEKWG
ncbi:hypothetical protein Daus18300_010333 [Diaporthe australafricana]|uniref:Uncharacterized protein n=1 Tax=Diaporthe australafricana TaxID=127596 RepID=A0ABR3WAV8_9PEZI